MKTKNSRLKWQFNIDKLKLCYLQPEGMFDEFLNSEKDYIDKGDYSLKILREDSKNGLIHLQPNQILVKVFVKDCDNEKNLCLGTLIINDKNNEYHRYCFFTFENRCFYTFLTGYQGRKFSIIPFIEFIADDLNLTFYHITSLDIALDCNANIISRLRKLIKNHKEEGLDMIFNNKKITDLNATLDGWKEIFSRSCKKLANTPSLYLTQKDEDAPELVIYNKSKEIENNKNEKEYIQEWNSFGKQSIFRLEVRLKNKSLKKIFNESPINSLEELQQPETLFKIWYTFANRILHFTNPKNRTIVDLTDLLE